MDSFESPFSRKRVLRAVEMAHITISFIVTPNYLLNTLIFGNSSSYDEAQFIVLFILPSLTDLVIKLGLAGENIAFQIMDGK